MKPAARLLILFSVLAYGCVAAAADVANNLLINSARQLDRAGVAIALKNGANINAVVGEHKRTSALSAAVEGTWGNSLLTDEQDSNRKTRLRKQAVEQGLAFLKFLVSRGAKLGKEDHEILFFPIAEGQIEIVRYLLSIGADPHARVGNYSAAQLAVRHSQSAVYKVLLSRKVNEVSQQEALQLQLVSAAGSRDFPATKALLSKGARVKDADSCGVTALGAAVHMPPAARDDVVYVLWLLNEGAEPTVPSAADCDFSRKEYPLAALFRVSVSHPLVHEFQQLLLVQMLLQGADVNAADWNGRTALHGAASGENIEAVEWLISKGADPLKRDIFGRTPLSLAKSPAILDVLMRKPPSRSSFERQSK